MKLKTAKIIAQELFDEIISWEDISESEENECVKEVIRQEYTKLVHSMPTVSDDRFKQRMEALMRSPLEKTPKSIRTWGTDLLDERMSPIEDNTYCIVAGMANSGKTAWMLDLAMKNARQGNKVLMYSLEMTTEQIYSRYAIEKAGITIAEFRTRNIPQHKKNKYKLAYSSIWEVDNLDLKGSGDGEQDLDSILEYVKSEAPSLCIIDNLGLIRNGKGNELEVHASISRKLLAFTNNENIPVVLVHHLNKQKDIRGTQKIIDDADMVLVTARKIPEEGKQLAEGEEKEFFIKVRKDRLFGKVEQIHTIYFNNGVFTDDPVPGF